MSLCTGGGITIVLVSDEPTSLTDAYAFIKLLTMQEPGADIRVVVNMVANDKDHARRTHAALTNACRNFLGIDPPLLGFVPRDKLVRDAIRHQMPILFRHPQARASRGRTKDCQRNPHSFRRKSAAGELGNPVNVTVLRRRLTFFALQTARPCLILV